MGICAAAQRLQAAQAVGCEVPPPRNNRRCSTVKLDARVGDESELQMEQHVRKRVACGTARRTASRAQRLSQQRDARQGLLQEERALQMATKSCRSIAPSSRAPRAAM